MTKLTFQQAKEIWKGRWLKRKIRDLSATYDVDPRRLYEVWEEDIHKGSREEAFTEFRSEFPAVAAQVRPVPHVPRLKVTRREAQPNLFG